MTGGAVRLREAGETDAAIVYRLFEELQGLHHRALPAFFRPPRRDRLFRAFFDNAIRDDSLFLTLAESGGQPIGYAHYGIVTQSESIYEKAGQYVYVQQLIVTAKKRHQGVAMALLGHIKAFADDCGIEDIGIDCWSFNEAARACFEKAGFRVYQHLLWHEPPRGG